MNLNKLSRWLFLANRTTRDVNAIQRGKIAGRIGNRIMGRLVSKAMRGAWFK